MSPRALITVVCVLLVVTAGCMSPTDETDQDRLHLGLNDSGSCYEAERGTEFAVNLSENPSTGYSWNVTREDGVSLTRNTYLDPDSSRLGAPGTRQLEGTIEETGRLRMEYVRSFEDSKPERVFEVEFAVGEYCPVNSSE